MYKVNGYIIKVSTRKNKKYDVFKNNEYITSFGDKRYQQYKDRLGHYSYLDHKDKDRRENYRSRHKNDNINNPNYAGYWAYNFLWN
jgi:hypothetical protein